MRKTCYKCKVEKPFSEFYKSKAKKDGLQPHCKACVKAYDKNRAEYFKSHYYANHEAILEKQNRYTKTRREDSRIRLIDSLTNRILAVFKAKGYKRELSIDELVGGVDNQIKHIESRFKSGQDWSNYGEWEIDHLVPLGSAEDDIHLLELCHFSNTQPLWIKENRTKYNKIIACRVHFKHELVSLE